MTQSPSSPPAPSVAVSPPGHRRQLLSTIWTLAWPVILTLCIESVVGLADMVMVGRLGATAVAGVGLGVQVLTTVSVVMFGVGAGTLAIVARHIGAGETHAAEEVLMQSILAAVGLAFVAITPVALWAPQIIGVFGVEAAVVAAGTPYLRLVMLGVPVDAIIFIVAFALRGAGDTRTPLVIVALVAVVNVVCNYALIFGKLGCPALGPTGAAGGTVIAFTTGAGLTIALLARGRLALRPSVAQLWPRPVTIRRIAAIGYPAAAEHLMMQAGFFVYFVFTSRYGTSAVAAYVIGVRILALSFLPGIGFAAAAGALVGQNLGAGRPDDAEHSGWESTRLAACLMTAAGGVIFLLAEPVARIFVDDPAVIRDAVPFIQILAAAQPLMALDFTLGGSLRGAGDTRFPLVAVIIGFYACRLGAAYLVTFVFEWSLFWLWFALVPDYVARSLLKGYRFRSGHWKHITV